MHVPVFLCPPNVELPQKFADELQAWQNKMLKLLSMLH